MSVGRVEPSVRDRPGIALWLLWTVVTVVAALPGLYLGWSAYEYIRSVWVPFPGLLLGAAITWAFVAATQTPILKRYMPGMKWWEWTVANAAGAAVGAWPILIYAYGPPLLLNSAAAACTGGCFFGFWCGLIVGAAQWVVLSGQEHQLSTWVWASPVSSSLGAVVGLLVTWRYSPDTLVPGTSLAVGSCVLGIFAVNAAATGFALVRLLRSR